LEAQARTPGILRYYQDQAEAHSARAKNPDMKELDPIADDLAKIYEETLPELQNRGS
jgi:hypothetical protein